MRDAVICEPLRTPVGELSAVQLPESQPPASGL